MKSIFLLTMVSIMFLSCNRDAIEEVPQPKNELENKGHDNWTKVEIIIREGHLHGDLFHANPALVDIDEKDGVYFLPKEQKIIFEQNEKGEVIRKREDLNVRLKGKDSNGKNIYETYYVTKEANAPIEVLTGTKYDATGQPASARYSMEIVYYNGKERINKQFITPEQINYHQHFFTTKEYTNWVTNQSFKSPKYLGDELFDYVYRDTDPEDRMVATSKSPGARLTNDPVGLKGYFYFAKNQVKFDMNVNLAHLYISKYQNGKTSPANNPSLELLIKGTTDFSQSIPFVVVGNNGDDVDAYIQDLARYYKVSEEKIEEYLYADAIGGAESSNFWL